MGRPTLLGAGTNSYDPDALRYFNQVVSNGGEPLTLYWKSKLNVLMLSIKARGELGKWVDLYLPCNQHIIAARTSFINPSRPMADYVGTFGASYMWRAFRGIKIVDATGYVDPKFNAATDGGSIHTLNSCSQIADVIDNVDGVYVDTGGGDATKKSYIFSAYGGTCYNALNTANAGADTTFANGSNLDNLYSSVRLASNDLDGYKGATKTDGTGASLGLPNISQLVGAYNDNTVIRYNKVGATYRAHGHGAGDVNIAALKADLTALFNQKQMICRGHSIVAGNNGTNLIRGWTTYAAGLLGLREENFGVNSTCLEYIAPTDPVATPSGADPAYLATIPVYNAAVHDRFVFMYCVNDTGFNYPNYTSANMESQTGAIIQACLNQGWPASKIHVVEGHTINPAMWTNNYVGFGTPPVTVAADNTRYAAMQLAEQNACNTKGALYVSVQADFIANGGYAALTADGLHPNEAGYQVIGQSYARQAG